MRDANRSSLLARLPGRWEARDIAPLVSLAVLLIFFAVEVPNFFKPATLTAILQQGAVLALVSVGLTYVLLCGEIDLAVGMMALWCACCCGWLFENWALGPDGQSAGSAWMIAVVILLPLLSCLLLGALCGALTVWSRLPSFIISLAMMFIAEGLARFLTRSKMHEVPALLETIGNEGIRMVLFMLPYSAMLAAGVFLLAHVVLQYTCFGRYVYATGGNREAARLSGISTGRIVLACMALCAVTAGIGGMVNAGRMSNVTLDQNKDLLLSAVACVVLGGTSLFGGEGSVGKTAIGVLIFTVLNVGLMQLNFITFWIVRIPIDDLARQLLTGIVLMAALVINGLLAKRQ